MRRRNYDATDRSCGNQLVTSLCLRKYLKIHSLLCKVTEFCYLTRSAARKVRLPYGQQNTSYDAVVYDQKLHQVERIKTGRQLIHH